LSRTPPPSLLPLALHDALPILQGAIRDNDAVGGSEALFYPAGEVDTLLNQNDRIAADFLGGFDLLQHIGCIACGAVVHFLIVVRDRKSTRLNSSHVSISYAVFC